MVYDRAMVEIDGSQGEGGGQILRTALSLSILTGQTLKISNIRANRKSPGLKPQHLKAVDAAAAISKASVEGAFLHSTSLLFEPGSIRTGRYRFDIGTAGSTSLVLQTIALPLCLANSSSSVIITGGTHVPWSPCFHYLNLHWRHFLVRIGFDLKLEMDLAGFYPQGGGKIRSTLRPAKLIAPLKLIDRGTLRRIYGISAVANLDMSIARRQKHRAIQFLSAYDPDIKIITHHLPSKYKGTMLLLIGEFGQSDDDYTQCCYFSLGALGKPAEVVADEAVEKFINFYNSSGTIDQYLTDQLLLPLAFSSSESVLHTSQITTHLLTNAEILHAFQVAMVQFQGAPGKPGMVKIIPRIDAWKL